MIVARMNLAETIRSLLDIAMDPEVDPNVPLELHVNAHGYELRCSRKSIHIDPVVLEEERAQPDMIELMTRTRSGLAYESSVYQVYECSRCHCTVAYDQRETHDLWHIGGR